MDFVCDLDGTVWLGGHAIPGVDRAIARARAAGHRFLFATNNSSDPPEVIAAALARIGIPATGAVVSSAMAAAGLVRPGERGFVVGGAGLRVALESRGASLVEPAAGERGSDMGVDFVVIGRDTSFDFAALDVASDAIRAGARFIATNDDPTFAGPRGLEPGCGAIVAAVATASLANPEIAGKPHAPMAAAIAAALGGQTDQAVVVGDVWSTDGLLAVELDRPFALVRSRATAADDLGVVPQWQAPSLAELLDRLAP